MAFGRIKTKIKEELSYCDHIQQVLTHFLSLPSYLNGPGYMLFGAALNSKWPNSCNLCSFFLNPFKMTNACNYDISIKTNRQVTAHRATEKGATLQCLVGREQMLGEEGRETHYEDPRICMFVGLLALHKAYVPRLGASTRSLTFGPQVCLWPRPR